MNCKTLQKISYGLYVICATHNNRFNGQIANAVFQVTANPPTIAISINKQNCTHEYVSKSKAFSISILSEDTPMTFIGTFGFKCGRTINKFQDVDFIISTHKTPIITQYSIGYLEAQVINKVDVGTHTIFIGEINEAELLSDEPPMTYEYYHTKKGGFAPKTAPTYSKEIETNIQKKKQEEKNMDKYVCTVCGYVYDPEQGDPDNGIKPGTPFEEIPDDWVCPVCGAEKEAFEKQ